MLAYARGSKMIRMIDDDDDDTDDCDDDHDHDQELSPHFDYEEDAIQWRDRLKDMLK